VEAGFKVLRGEWVGVDCAMEKVYQGSKVVDVWFCRVDEAERDEYQLDRSRA
jgi:hypothetical protein